MSEREQKTKALIGLAGVIVLPLLPIGRWLAPGESITSLLIREAVWWGYAAGVLLWLTFAEALPLSSIDLRRPGWKTLLWGVVGAAALLAAFALSYAVIFPLFHLDTSHAGAERNAILARPFWYRFLMVSRAAVVEEILFRGYIIEKVRQLTGSAVLAATVSVAVYLCSPFGMGFGSSDPRMRERDYLCHPLSLEA